MSLIPAGFSPDLERAVLAVYADLDSRIASLRGGADWAVDDPQYALECLDFGAQSFARFPSDLAIAQSLAAQEPPPAAAADSVAAGVLAVRLDWIHGLNWGCAGCGGAAVDLSVPIDQSLPVDWGARRLGPDAGVEFEATFDGSRWDVLIYAC